MDSAQYGGGAGDQIFCVLGYRVSIACVQRHCKFEFDQTLLSLVEGQNVVGKSSFISAESSVLNKLEEACSFTK